MLLMEIHRHDSTLSCERILRPSRVFDCEAADQPLSLFKEIIWSISYGKEIFVFGVPADWCDVFPSSLFVGKSPDGENWSVIVLLFILGFVLIILIIAELSSICVLNDHSFHDLKTSLHRSRVKGVFLDCCRLLVGSLFFDTSLLLLFCFLLHSA